MLMRASLALVLCGALANITEAQVFKPREGSERPGTWSFTIGGQAAEPVGAFKANVSNAWGIGGTLRYLVNSSLPLGLRADFTFLNYGNENKRVPLSNTINRVSVQMNTTNNIALASAGPELVLLRGPVSPYVYGFVGYSYFYTETDARDHPWGESFASSTNFDDGGLATGWGGGLRIPLRLRAVNASIDVGARHTRNGIRQYLRPGDIVDVPGGFVATPRQSAADYRQYHLGVSFAWRRS